MYRLLVDTCVWIDLAKDRAQYPLLDVLDKLIKEKEISLIVPDIVPLELKRNKERIVKESGQSLSAIFRRVKEVVGKFGDPEKKEQIIEQLNEVDFKLPQLGEAVADALQRIELILKKSKPFAVHDSVKVKAVQRAIDKTAPFHRSKNSINDALLIECYLDEIRNSKSKGDRFMFITHNKNDFSDPAGNEKNPHPHFAKMFSKLKSRYLIKLPEALNKIAPDLITETMMDDDLFLEQRSLSEIMNIENELSAKIWYNRHKIREEQIAAGELTIVPRDEYLYTIPNTIVDYIWEGAKLSAKKVEEKYGIDNVGPWDDFEWGMLNGKLSAIRWIVGESWDSLYT